MFLARSRKIGGVVSAVCLESAWSSVVSSVPVRIQIEDRGITVGMAPSSGYRRRM